MPGCTPVLPTAAKRFRVFKVRETSLTYIFICRPVGTPPTSAPRRSWSKCCRLAWKMCPLFALWYNNLMLTSGLFLDGHAYNGTTLFQKSLQRDRQAPQQWLRLLLAARSRWWNSQLLVEQINLVKICRTRMGRHLGTERWCTFCWASTVTLLIVGRGGCLKQLGLLGHGRAD